VDGGAGHAHRQQQEAPQGLVVDRHDHAKIDNIIIYLFS
jgi:hypothetical protein